MRWRRIGPLPPAPWRCGGRAWRTCRGEWSRKSMREKWGNHCLREGFSVSADVFARSAQEREFVLGRQSECGWGSESSVRIGPLSPAPWRCGGRAWRTCRGEWSRKSMREKWGNHCLREGFSVSADVFARSAQEREFVLGRQSECGWGSESSVRIGPLSPAPWRCAGRAWRTCRGGWNRK